MSGGATAAPAVSGAASQAEYWNSPATRPWAEQHERMDRALADLATQALGLAKPQTGEHALDIGCGSGTTLLELAARVGPGGYALGADIAEHSVARARQRIAAAGLKQAEAICANVATHAFPAGHFDLAFSRLGVMFFPDPVAAFTNVRRAMKPNGRLAFAVFRSPAENPWPSAPVAAVGDLVPPIPSLQPDQPGMFALSDPARVERIFTGAGFRDVMLTPIETALQIAGAGGVAEAAEFATLFGPLMRVLPGLSAERREAVRARLEEFFHAYATPQGVHLKAALWIIQARA